MFKLCVLFALVACSMAAPKPGLLAAAEVPAVAIAESVPVASSYSDTYKVSVKSPLISTAPVAVAPAAPVVAAPIVPAPLAAAPIAAAPIASAPVALAPGTPVAYAYPAHAGPTIYL